MKQFTGGDNSETRYRTGSGPGSQTGQSGWGGGSDRVALALFYPVVFHQHQPGRYPVVFHQYQPGRYPVVFHQHQPGRYRSRFCTVICLIAIGIWGTAAHAQHRSGASRTRGNAPAEKSEKLQLVRAQSGDTLISLAERYDVDAGELAQLNRLQRNSKLKRGQRVRLPAAESSAHASETQGPVIGKRIKFADGKTLDVDEAWRMGAEVWFKRAGVTQSAAREVKSIDPIFGALSPAVAAQNAPPAAPKPSLPSATWIYLVGGARFKVDQVNETSDGAWYNRNNLSVFLARDRIERIERDLPFDEHNGPLPDWTSGSSSIDRLIRTNGGRFGVDPYLVFLVIEQESHFRTRVVSPKGAQGLMQLMPGTARRFGVRKPFDPTENIRGGTQYLKELLDMFDGRVDLALASYNAGEGRVIQYGHQVPPFRETREYVRRISKRYGKSLSGKSKVPRPIAQTVPGE